LPSRIELEFDASQAASDAIAEALSSVIAAAAFSIEAAAKAVVPVDTGNLRSSIQTTIIDDMNASVDVGAEYGIFVEYGTRRMAAEPFMTPAVAEVQPTIPDMAAAAINVAVSKVSAP